MRKDLLTVVCVLLVFLTLAKADDLQAATKGPAEPIHQETEANQQDSSSLEQTKGAQEKELLQKGEEEGTTAPEAANQKESEATKAPQAKADEGGKEREKDSKQTKGSEKREGPPSKKKKPFTFKIAAHGFATLSYQVGSTVQGTEQGRQVFRNEYFGLTKGFNAYGSLGVDWQIGRLRLKGQYSPFSYSPTDQQFQAEYDAGPTKTVFGNQFLSLEGNNFVSFSRYARGIKLDHQLGGGSTLSLLSFETPTQVVTDIFQGTNSPGPYFLTRTPILEGTEQVRLDERPLRRGLDYTIDYASGFITFATPVPTTSKIAVSYESAGAGGVGRFIGSRATIRLAPNSALGITYLSQRVPLTREVGVRRRRDEFIGDGSVGPFQLMARPVAVGSERVYVDGLLQVAGSQYQINYQSGLITFLRPVRAGALVAVEYEQAAAQQRQLGLLSMVGLDWNTQIRGLGRLALQYGLSRGGDRTGDAIEVVIGQDRETIGYSLRWRRIKPTFQRIESADFFRNEDGLSADLRWQIAPFLGLTTRWQTGRSAGPRFFGVGQDSPTSQSRNQDMSINLDFTKPKLPRIQIGHQRLSSSLSVTGGTSDSDKTLTSVYTGYQVGHWSLEGAWERSEDSFSSPLTGGSGPTTTSATTARKRLSINFRPGSAFQVGADWSQNTSRGARAFQSDATQRVLRFSYTPTNRLDISISFHKLTGASSVSSLLVGNVLSGAAGGFFSGVGYGGSAGYSWGSTGPYGAPGAGYGTFGTGTRPSYPGVGPGVTPYPSVSWGDFGSPPTGGTVWETPSPGTRWGLSRELGRQAGGGLTPTVTDNESSARVASLLWTPFERLQLSVDWTETADKGSGYIAPSRQRDIGFTSSYQIGRDWNFYLQLNRSRTSYLDQLNESLTLVGAAGLTFGSYSGFHGSLNLQRLRMQSLRLVGRVPQLDETTFSALSLSLQVPIGKKWMFRMRGTRLMNSGGASAFGASYRVDEAEATLEYQIVRGIGFGANWTLTRRRGARFEQNYSASVFRAQLSLGF
ncbi:MAG: hypothetical protein NZ959_09365 [Armatimonadetes bacterium]|nr:hypothetical protein [Armatimonadota bacterium]MDW8122162.1 hypothetical protein [Armatimonadota bacterium]